MNRAFNSPFPRFVERSVDDYSLRLISFLSVCLCWSFGLIFFGLLFSFFLSIYPPSFVSSIIIHLLCCIRGATQTGPISFLSPQTSFLSFSSRSFLKHTKTIISFSSVLEGISRHWSPVSCLGNLFF